MKHMFDFKAASKEFNDLVNQDAQFEINPKILQLKWTDIEIRKYRMQELKASKDQKPEPNFDPEEPMEPQPFDSDFLPGDDESTNLEELD